MVIPEQLREKVIETGDVRGVAVYAKPDRFDREWQFGGSFPLVRRRTEVVPGAFRP